MKLFLAFFALMTAQAMSLKDFNTKPTHDRSVYVVDFIEKMTADLGAKNPQLAQDIRDWFSRKQEGKPFSEGLERLYVELGALEIMAHDGKVDLTKIQVEGVIVKVVKDKFPPQTSQK
jgi:soluble cytochrome b562